MTKLQQEIKEAIEKAERVTPVTFPDVYAITAAKVALRYIIQALNDSFKNAHITGDIVKTMHYQDWVRTWLKENGITE